MITINLHRQLNRLIRTQGICLLCAAGLTSAPVLDLDLTTALDSRITFSRGSSATYFDSAGVMQTASTNVARFNYLYNGSAWEPAGLLVEPAATNLLTRSVEFNNAAWLSGVGYYSVITADQISAPNGATTADVLKDDSGGGTGNVMVARALTLSVSTAYTFSVFVKAKQLSWVRLYLLDFTSPTNGGCFFDVANGAVGTAGAGITGTIKNCGNGWFRCAISWTSNAVDTSGELRIMLADADGDSTVDRDGTSDVYLWGAQLESGSVATSFIETTTATATRAADVAVITGTNFSDWFNPVEGTWVAEWTSVSSSSVVAQISDATNSNRFQILHDNVGQTAITTAGVGQGGIDGGTVSTTGTNKIAFAYKVNDMAASLNGGAVGTDATVTLPVVDRLTLGATVVPAGHLNGSLARLTYYPKRLSDAQLPSLST